MTSPSSSSSGRCFLGGRAARPSSGRLPDLRLGRVSNSAAAAPGGKNYVFNHYCQSETFSRRLLTVSVEDPGAFLTLDLGSRIEKIRILDRKHSDPGSGIRDKHSGSATLLTEILSILKTCAVPVDFVAVRWIS
jgi:hypothetical protein